MVVLLVLLCLQVKHWYIDFVNQSDAEVYAKGIYGDIVGIWHSVKHGLLTALVFLFFESFYISVLVGVIDFVLHYHIDWIKKNYGNQDITNKKFWNHLGLDQMVHQICYIGYVYYVYYFGA